MSNPIFTKLNNYENTITSGEIMSVQGVINKSVFMFIILFAGCFLQWELITKNYVQLSTILTNVGFITGFILALIIIFLKRGEKYLVPSYSFCEGLALGGLTIYLDAAYPGIAAQAVLATFGAFFTMLLLYKLKLIRATEKFRSILLISMTAILVIYILQWILSLFSFGLPQLFSSSPVGIGFGIFIVIIAALNFILDFANIEKAQEAMFGKEIEWYLSFGLMLTFVWLYVEILNLLVKLKNRN